MSSAVVFTSKAATKVKELIADEDNEHLNLRLYITGGGCSGFQYAFTFDDAVAAEDLVVEQFPDIDADGADTPSADTVQQPVKLVVDCMSMQYLQGAEVDYVEDLNGAQFVIRNPNAMTTCGCGQSFSVE